MSVGAQAGLRFPKVTGSWVSAQVPSPFRGKSCRTITFEQFKEALEELSKKRFKDKSSEEAVQEVHRLIEGKAPIISGVTVSGAGPSGNGVHEVEGTDGSGLKMGWEP